MKNDCAKTIKEYLIYHQKYQKEYGKNTFVLMEVGSFYEIHSLEHIESKTILGSDLDKLGELTDLFKSVRQILTYEGEKYRLFISGFPTHSQDKFINKLLSAGCVLIMVDQIGENMNGQGKIREVTRILSPGTAIDNIIKTNNTCNNNCNNTMCLIFNKGYDNSTRKPIYIVGISIIDFVTGTSYCIQLESTPEDHLLWIDECYRILHSYSPMEIIFGISKNCESEELFTKEYLTKELECKNIPIFYENNIPDKYYKPVFVEELLSKVFPNHSSYSTVEYLDMSLYEENRTSFVYLLNYAYEHDRTIIEKIKKPINEQVSERAVISSNAIHQLNIVSEDQKFCLMKLLNKCNTQMGKRRFEYTLLHPITNIQKLNERYNIIEILQKKDKQKKYICYEIHKELKNIIDIEKIHRRIGLIRCHPDELNSLILSYSFLLKIFDYLSSNKMNNLFSKLSGSLNLTRNFLEEYENYCNYFKNIFNFNELRKYRNIHDCITNIFQPNINKSIENLDKKNNKIVDTFECASVVFSKLIDDTKHSKGDNVVKYDLNTGTGIELYCTITRGKKLKNMINHRNEINIGSIKLKKSEIEIKTIKNKSIVYIHKLEKQSDEYIVNIQKMKKEINEEYNIQLQDTYKYFNKLMNTIVEIVSELDISSTNAVLAKEYCYEKPVIVSREDSFIDAIDLRHPIVERLQCNQDFPYIENNVLLDTDQKGILLFGTNACGKSTLMKAIGLSLIMAQSGLYVPACNFHYSPYKNFFTRILGNDNIYKGLSSFAIEMSELRSIFKRADNKALVLGDEICNGTESRSALAIVAAAIQGLCDKQSNFIFATHLHELNNIPELIEYPQVQKYHLKVIREGNKLIYDRKLTEGSGPAIYGLEVARAMDLDNELISRANKILIRLTDGTTNLVENHNSHYNSNILMNECKVCGESAKETHHIQEQQDANDLGHIGHIHKNRKSNLVPLCKKCHLATTHGKLVIKGYKYTSSGTELDYHYSEENKQKKSKYTEEELFTINEMKNIQPIRSKAVLELKNKGISISSSTLKKYWT